MNLIPFFLKTFIVFKARNQLSTSQVAFFLSKLKKALKTQSNIVSNISNDVLNT